MVIKAIIIIILVLFWFDFIGFQKQRRNMLITMAKWHMYNNSSSIIILIAIEKYSFDYNSIHISITIEKRSFFYNSSSILVQVLTRSRIPWGEQFCSYCWNVVHIGLQFHSANFMAMEGVSQNMFFVHWSEPCRIVIVRLCTHTSQIFVAAASERDNVVYWKEPKGRSILISDASFW